MYNSINEIITHDFILFAEIFFPAVSKHVSLKNYQEKYTGGGSVLGMLDSKST